MYHELELYYALKNYADIHEYTHLLSISRLAVEISSKLEANDKESDVLLARNSPAAVAEEYHLLITGPWLDAKRALDLTNPEDEYKESKVRLLRHIIMVT